MNTLAIKPFRKPATGQARVPGSKSISNRALLLAFLSDTTVRIENLLHSEDTDTLRAAFTALGVDVTEDKDSSILVTGCAGNAPVFEVDLEVDNAGTVARFLPAALSLLRGGTYRLDGSAAMRKRPMAGLLDCLTSLGSKIQFQAAEGFFPFTLCTHGWTSDVITVDASRSSQILSALLIAATRAPTAMTIRLAGDTVSRPFVEMTLRMIEQFGGDAAFDSSTYRITPGLPGPSTGHYPVEPDATAASYFFALPIATGGSTSVGAFPKESLQGDLAFLSTLASIGLETKNTDGFIHSAAMGALQSADEDFNAFSDTFLTLAALAPLLPETTRIRGIGHTRHQETDRISAMAQELLKLGQKVTEKEDSLTIKPNLEALRTRTADSPITIETYNDHRVAMSFGILGSHDLHGDGRPWIVIRNPKCCEKTFPNFFEELARLRSVANATSTIND